MEKTRGKFSAAVFAAALAAMLAFAAIGAACGEASASDSSTYQDVLSENPGAQYTLADVDGDGVDELFVIRTGNLGKYAQWLDVYTVKDGSVAPIDVEDDGPVGSSVYYGGESVWLMRTYNGCSSVSKVESDGTRTVVEESKNDFPAEPVLESWASKYGLEEMTTAATSDNCLLDCGWKHSAKGWWYKGLDGSCPHDAWKQLSGTWYHFDKSGYMQTGWLKDKGAWYYLQDDGAMAVDQWVGDDHVDANGAWDKSR